jgi:hypothetical protein
MIRIVQIAVPLYVFYCLIPLLSNFYHTMTTLSNVLP